MTLARLLAATLLLCSLSALAQDRQAQSFQPSNRPRSSKYMFGRDVEGPISLRDERFFFAFCPHNAATPSEPWRIFPNSPATLVSGQSRPDQIPADQLELELRARLARQLVELAVQEEGPTCYAIRSYVVARDSKDSDSTHRVSYSTCQPAARYQLKTTEMRSVTVDY
jgi:arylamine N-acetyltransferase